MTQWGPWWIHFPTKMEILAKQWKLNTSNAGKYPKPQNDGALSTQ